MSIDADVLRADLQAAMRLKAIAGEAASAESLLQRRVKRWAHQPRLILITAYKLVHASRTTRVLDHDWACNPI